MFGDMEFWREKIHMRQDLSAQIINAFHRLTSVSAGNSPVCAYTLNAKDQRTSSSLADGSSWAYGYDSRSQLSSAVKSVGGTPTDAFGYLYDDIGNRTSSTEGGVTRAYTANNLNQYTAITNPSVSPTHDGDGNMTFDGEWTYTWNADNRLIAIENAMHREEYDYDYMGRRWRLKTFTKSGNAWVLDSEKLFVYDGYRQIAEFRNWAKKLQQTYCGHSKS